MTIGNHAPLRREIEAQIAALGLRQRGVKIWMSRYLNTDDFSALSEEAARRLLAVLPRMALQKVNRAIPNMDRDELEAFLRRPPAWLTGTDRDEMLVRVDDRLAVVVAIANERAFG